MAGVEWKASLSALDRYEVIQTLAYRRASLPPAAQGDAVAIEQAAYQGAASREGYNAACDAGVATRSKSSSTSPSSPSHDAAPDGTSSDHSANDRGGTRIGPYTNCTPIAEGVTSQVFRSGSNALKVITTHRNIEPHNPRREAKILSSLSDCPEVITLLDVFHDQAQFMVLRFPYMPLTLAAVIDQGGTSRGGSAPSKGLSQRQLGVIFRDVLLALSHIHPMGIIHRDIKPSAILLASPTGPGRLSDFGTAWHPSLSAAVEPRTTRSSTSVRDRVDMWSLGVALAEAATGAPPFESRPASEDGSQLGLILSVFKTLGTPTPETWPEAQSFKVSPFQLWTVFPQRPWTEIMPGVNDDTRAAVAAMVRFDKERVAAAQALELPLFANI
ncbi:hypothetical protein ACCO45_002542 [Purpureocillium lilacinum]|uniref:Uncharacterized protein n=1 Tax=Purpureocillium lilacinum TaxID=33203 RepID=A0ACC4EB96_PURLI